MDRSPEQEAVRLLRAGELVAVPTETVYGLAADARNPEAVRRIFAAKGRPADHPLIVHLPDATHLAAVAQAPVPPLAVRLAARFWPGPLTLVLRRSAAVPDAVTAGLETVAVRVPAHPVTLALLRAFGGWLAAPSANRFGEVSPTTAAHVRADLGDRVALVLDGGPCDVGIESTILDLSGGEPVILRPGGVSAEALAEILGFVPQVGASEGVRAPGTLPAHYQPRARVELLGAAQLAARAAQVAAGGEPLAIVLGQGGARGPWPAGAARFELGDDASFARGLYATLREVDARGLAVVLVEEPAGAGLAVALRDRLARAAHRPSAAPPQKGTPGPR